MTEEHLTDEIHLDSLLKAQLETAEQIANFMSSITIDLFDKPDFLIDIHREIMWNNRGDPFGKYDLVIPNLVVPDKNNLRFSVLSAIITKTTYQVYTNTRCYDDNVKTTINNIKNRLEAYFSIFGFTVEKRYDYR